MGIWGKIFGTDEAISKAVGTVASGLDALVYTAEEKAHDHAAAVTEARSMLVEWMRASQGHRLARRVISLSITGVWLLMYVMSMVLNVCAVWMVDPTRVRGSAKIIGDYADSMNGAVMLILAFYFAAPHIGDVVKPAMEKFSRKPEA